VFQKIDIRDFRLFHDKSIRLGKYLTVLSGRNSTGKSTILGMIANSAELKKKDGITYSSGKFQADFSELFKGSRTFDAIGADRFTITLSDEQGNEIDMRSFRTAWQKKDSYRRKQAKTELNEIEKEEAISEENSRFRVIPFKKLDNGKKTEAKFAYPVLYLGLSRLFPLGEARDSDISTKSISFKSDEHRAWFIEKYVSILSMQCNVNDITSYSIGESSKSGIGINTDSYDYLTNSSGQDNLGQILLGLLSFRKLKEEQVDDWKGGIFLIDEVDATLHPAAQEKLLKLFTHEARTLGIQIVFTTHSLSLLRNVSNITAHNSHDENVNNNVELYYLTQANRRLEIKRNIPFTEIESDLCVNSIIQNGNKIKLYTEDEEARWFLGYLVPEYLPYVEVLNVSTGCDQLINFYCADVAYFGNTMIVFDGDVKESQLKVIPDAYRKNLGNILKLPGEIRPEEVIYRYLLSLPADHEYWSGSAARLGFTWDYFNEHGPESDDYSNKKEREKYKEWFKNHKSFFESTRIMEFWLRDNNDIHQEFRNQFKTIHNRIANRMLTYLIDD